MKIKVLRNIGDHLKRSLGADELEDAAEGAEIDVSKDVGKELIKQQLAEPVGAAAKKLASAEEEDDSAGSSEEDHGGTDYEAMTLEELHAEASLRNLEGLSHATKKELIKALKKDDKK